MSRHILLDSSPLGLLFHPARNADTIAIVEWTADCLAAGHHVYIAEVIDYEVRRELLRAGKTNSIAALDSLKATFDYLPISTSAMLRAAVLWADSRNRGISTGDPRKLDIDVILAAQAPTLAVPASEIVVATSNVSHLARFVAADLWTNIKS